MALTKGQKIAIGVTAGVVTIGGIVLAVKWKDWFGKKTATTGGTSGTTVSTPLTTQKKKTGWDKVQNFLTFGKEAVEIAEGVSNVFQKQAAEGKLEPIAYEYIKQ